METFGCPHLNLNDPRCSRHFRLSRLEEAFSICLNGYRECPTYQRIEVEHAGVLQVLTIDGRRYDAVEPRLRRTGS